MSLDAPVPPRQNGGVRQQPGGRSLVATIVLARLVAGSDIADSYVDLLGDFAGDIVVVDARETTSASPSFVAGLVRRVLADGGAARLVLVGAGADFAEYARRAAESLGVGDSLDFSAEVPAST